MVRWARSSAATAARPRQRARARAFARICAAGKPAGVLAFDQAVVRRYIELGASFAAVSSDVTLLTSGARQLAQSFKAEAGPARAGP